MKRPSEWGFASEGKGLLLGLLGFLALGLLELPIVHWVIPALERFFGFG